MLNICQDCSTHTCLTRTQHQHHSRSTSQRIYTSDIQISNQIPLERRRKTCQRLQQNVDAAVDAVVAVDADADVVDAKDHQEKTKERSLLRRRKEEKEGKEERPKRPKARAIRLLPLHGIRTRPSPSSLP